VSCLANHVLIGIGSTLKGDDGIGTIVAKEFKEQNPEGWLCLACETMPENFLAVAIREKPQVVVLVDAAEMGLKAGELRILPKKKLSSAIVGTHGMPLKHLVEELEGQTKEIFFIGVEPGSMRLGEELSSEIEAAKKKVLQALKKKNWNTIEKLG